jgi:hypothetical protein
MTNSCIGIGVSAWMLACLSAPADDRPGPAIAMAAFGERYTNQDQTDGDTWDSAWLADGRVLVQYNDGNGFSLPHANVHHDGLCELQGNPQDLSTIKGVDLNPGKLGNFLGQTYSTGIYEIDHALYHLICRSVQIPGAWQFYDTSLYKSVDGGATWINHRGEKNRYIPEDLSAATFPDKRWGEVNFIKYGRGGEAPDLDRAREFAYLSCGPHLARIRRSDLTAWTGVFDRTKIEYYCGADNADGKLDSNWTHDISRCTAIYTGLEFLTMIWNPGLRRYLTVSGIGDSWENPPIPSTFFIFEAPHPWGPWTEINQEYIEPRVGDNLSWFFLMQDFTSPDGTRMWATFSGRKPYGLQFLPIYLTTHPVETRLASDAKLNRTILSDKIPGSISSSYIAGFNKIGDGCTFTLPVKTTGLYALRYRYHNNRAGQTISLTVNGVLHGHLNLGDTPASKLPWNEGSARIWLTAGSTKISFEITPGDQPDSHLLLDRIQFALLSTVAER